MHEEVIVVVAAVLFGGVVAQWLGWRLRVPAIVFLLGGGLLAGPVTGALDPDHTFGELLFPFISMAVAVILFEGALGLGWKGVSQAGRTVWLLLSVGALITLIGSALLAHAILGIDWDLSVLLASVLVVTGPTVIGPIIRSIGLHGRLASILEAEGTLIDPMGAILTVVVFQVAFEATSSAEPAHTAILLTLAAGTFMGLVGAGFLVGAFGRYLIPDQLHNITTLATVIAAFAVSDLLREESGLVAVTVMGIALATQKQTPVRHVLEFNETLRILLISGLFVLLGARIEADTLREFEWRNVVFLSALVVLIRPLAVLVSTFRSPLSRRERVFLALTAPRGIVAAAIASVFSLRLEELGVQDSQILVSVTFTVIAGTVLLSGLGSRTLAIRLGLVERSRDTNIVLGANPVARAFAEALHQYDAPVRLVDLDRRELARARMTGLLAQRGSVFADQTWESAGLHQAAAFLAVTANDELNTLASRHAASVLGRRQVFQLAPSRPEHEAWWTLPTGTFARPLFAAAANYELLAQGLEDGWKVTGTRLTEKFGPDDHARMHPDAIGLFVVNIRGNVEFLAADSRRKPRAGETLVTLGPPHERP